MLNNILKALVLSLFGASFFIQADEIQWWKIAEKVPIFYQEPSESSKILPALKPYQTVVVLTEQKDWYKLADLTNGETGWVLKSQIKPTAVEKINTQASKEKDKYTYRSTYISSNSNGSFSPKAIDKWEKKLKEDFDNVEKHFADFTEAFSSIFNARVKELAQQGKRLQKEKEPKEPVVSNAKSDTTKEMPIKLNR